MKSKYLLWLAITLLGGFIYAVFIEQTQEPLLMYREQQQIFLMDEDYISSILDQHGGFAILSAQFLQQFFFLQWVGAILTSIIIISTCVFFGFVLYRINKYCKNAWMPLVMIPPFFQGLYLLDMNYHYEGVIALLLFSISLYLYVTLTQKTNILFRTITGVAFTILIYMYVGSIATLFAISTFTYDILISPSKGWKTSVYLIITLLAAFITVYKGWTVSYDYALWTKDYYDYHVEQRLWHSWSWVSVPLIMLVVKASDIIKLKQWAQSIICLGLIMAESFLFYHLSETTVNKDFRTLAELMNSINREDWDGIINNRNLNYQNYLHLNCINLALSHQGRMMTDLFKYPQKGSQSLMVPYQAYNDINVLFSHIYYQAGIVSEAMCLSFGTMIATPNGNPSMLKQLIKERLIFGDYEVAEKYISRLEKTFAYSGWASSMRKFLYNDDAILKDAELGMKRKCLPNMDTEFVVLDGIMADLIKVSRTGSKEAIEYAFAINMLDKDMLGVKNLVEEKLLKDLPELVQQAITVYAEHDEEYCRSHGVSEETINRFMSFKQTVINARRTNANLQATLASFKGTFWYYYLFG